MKLLNEKKKTQHSWNEILILTVSNETRLNIIDNLIIVFYFLIITEPQ